MKFPNILEFIQKDKSSLDFFSNLWKSYMVELIKFVSNIQTCDSVQEIILCTELMGIFTNLLEIISYNPYKTKINTKIEENIVFDLVSDLINNSNVSDLIIKFLKISLSRNSKDLKNTKELVINNEMNEFILNIDPSFDKSVISGLINITFQCLNRALDVLVLTLTTKDSKYLTIDLINTLYNNFFESKVNNKIIV